MQDLINKFETLLTRDKVEKCKKVKIKSYFVKEKLIFTVVLLYSLYLLVHLPRHNSQSAKRHLQDVLPRHARHLAKTSCRCPKDVLNPNLKDIFVRHLQETLARYIVDVLQKTS